MAHNREFEVANTLVQRGEKAFVWLPVTTLLTGQPLALPMHIIHGAKPGPTLGILCGTHGTEYTPIPALRILHSKINPADLSGTILIISVGNPISFAGRWRKTTGEWDYNYQDMNRSFPGKIEVNVQYDGAVNPPSNHNMTQMMAHTITTHLIARSDYLLDYHACGMLGRFVYEVPMQAGLPDALRSQTLALSLALNLGAIHEYGQGIVTATGYATRTLGIPATTAEFGGVMMDLATDRQITTVAVDSTLNVLRHLGMLPGDPVIRSGQLLYKYQSQVRPTKAGYLLSEYDADAVSAQFPYGVEVKAGDLLGTVFDPYTFKEVEQIRAEVDGLLLIPMRNGPVAAGDLGYVVADYRESERLEGGV